MTTKPLKPLKPLYHFNYSHKNRQTYNNYFLLTMRDNYKGRWGSFTCFRLL